MEWHHISQRSCVGSKLNEPELHLISAGFLFSDANSQLRLYASNGAKRTDGDELHSCNGHLCLYRDLKILKVMIPATYVRNLQPLGLQHRVSWRHPRSNHWHQLDLILTRRSCLPSVQITRSYQSADCDTDPSLVCSKAKLRTKKVHRTKKEGRPRIDNSKTRDQGKVEEFARVLEKSLPGPSGVSALEKMGAPQRCHVQRRHDHLWQEDQQTSRLVRGSLRRNQS